MKLSFYTPKRRAPQIKTIPYLNHLKLADIDTIASLKMETMMRRNMLRDYYDLYCILKDKTSEQINDIIQNALKYSGHNLKSKNLLGVLVNASRFDSDSGFSLLAPTVDISAKEIETFMIEKVRTAYHKNKKIKQT